MHIITKKERSGLLTKDWREFFHRPLSLSLSLSYSQADRAGLDKALKGENSESTRDHLLAETIVKQCTELPASSLLSSTTASFMLSVACPCAAAFFVSAVRVVKVLQGTGSETARELRYVHIHTGNSPLALVAGCLRTMSEDTVK